MSDEDSEQPTISPPESDTDEMPMPEGESATEGGESEQTETEQTEADSEDSTSERQGPSNTEWEGPDYAMLAGNAPFDGSPSDYTHVQRRAEIYGMIRDAGHPSNLEKNQTQLANRYDVSQPMISKDIKALRKYEAEHNSERAKAVTGWLAEATVKKHIQAAREHDEQGRTEKAADRFEDALDAHLSYVDYMMDTGDLDSAPDRLEIEGDAGDVYMKMLEQANEDR